MVDTYDWWNPHYHGLWWAETRIVAGSDYARATGWNTGPADSSIQVICVQGVFNALGTLVNGPRSCQWITWGSASVSSVNPWQRSGVQPTPRR